jgi:hypothetical protein
MTLRTHIRRRGRRLSAAVVSLLVLAGLLAAAVVPAIGAVDDELLPDLVAEPVDHADSTATVYDVDGESRLLLRFTSYIRNVGPGPLEVTGVNPSNERISGNGLRQVITHADATETEVALPGAQLKYEETDGHNHWHFQKAASYTLWNDSRTQAVGFASKVGFCFLDIGHGDPNYVPGVDDPAHFPYSGTVAPRAFYHAEDPVADPAHAVQPCLNGQPSFGALDKVDMGISTGWRDIYERQLPFQYVDVSDLTPGHYWVRSDVDPDDLIKESDEANAAAFAADRSTVPGYVAKPVNAGQISGVKESTSTITLASTAYGSPSGLRYKITDQPDHGTLKPATGSADAGGWFAAGQVVYKKNGAYNGPDTFKFAAKQAGSQFPLSPASASVTMQVGSGNGATTVGINGAQPQLYTSGGLQLSASVVPNGPVAWRVDDVLGGNAQVGTIDSSGYYRAPASVPAAGKVRITATSEDGAFDAVEIAIVPRPVVKPLPDVPNPPKPPAAKPLPTLGKPVIGRVGRRLLVKYMPGKSGRLTITIATRGKRLASCSAKVQAKRAMTCRFMLKKSKVRKLTGKLSVRARLTSGKRTLAVRSTTVSLRVTSRTARIGPLCILTP